MDLLDFERQYRENGFFWNDVLKAFLAEYGGKKIVYPHYSGGETFAEFGVVELVRKGKGLSEWASMGTGEKTAPVGLANRYYMFLYLTESGKLYGYEEGSWFTWDSCDNWRDALNVMLSGREHIEFDMGEGIQD